MADGHEIELKLSASAAMLAHLRSMDMLQGEGRARHFSTVYYDTPDQRLAAAHLALRVRNDGKSCEITVKRGATGKAISRAEWNAPLDGPQLDLGALPPQAARLVIKAAKGADLKPAFSLVVDRDVRAVAFGRSKIELAFDEGHVTAGGRTAPLCELELELLSGSLKDLLGLVRTLPLGPELYWSTTSKSAVGYRLADGTAPNAVKARPIRLPANIGTRAALRRIVWSSIGQFLANVDALVIFSLPEGLHQMRVALRRLRVALRLAHDMLEDADAPVLDAQWGAAIGVMGTARDLDVILARLTPKEKEAVTETGDDVRRALAEERTQAYASVVGLIQSASFQHLLAGTVHWAEHLGGPQPDDLPLRQAARALLKSWRRKLRRKSGHLADISPEARHRIRIGLKRLRYATEFFTSLLHDPARKTLDRLRLDRLADAQEHLGDLNDLDVAVSLGVRLKGDPLHRAAILEALEAAAQDEHRHVPKLLEKAQDAVDFALAKRKKISVRASGKQR